MLSVVVAYAIGGWVLLQAGDVLIGLLELPAWTGKALVALIAVGMPDFLKPVRTLQCLLHEANKQVRTH